VALATPPFTLFWHLVVGGCQVTSFELWTAIIGSQTTPEKCFNTPIENALCRCQCHVPCRGKYMGYPYRFFTPNVRSFLSGCIRLCQISSKSAKIANVRALKPPMTHWRTSYENIISAVRYVHLAEITYTLTMQILVTKLFSSSSLMLTSSALRDWQLAFADEYSTLSSDT